MVNRSGRSLQPAIFHQHTPQAVLGGIIVAEPRIAMEALEQNTARLPTVEIVPATALVGRSTVESIQSGLYFGNRAIVRGLTQEIREQMFEGEPAVVIGTGGLSRLFERANVFDVVLPDLVLVGLERALSLNDGASRRWSPAGNGSSDSDMTPTPRRGHRSADGRG